MRVWDGGSHPHYSEVQVQGVPAEGIVDSGADITIMGAELFKREAAFLPPSSPIPTDIDDYREELVLSFSNARHIAKFRLTSVTIVKG